MKEDPGFQRVHQIVYRTNRVHKNGLCINPYSTRNLCPAVPHFYTLPILNEKIHLWILGVLKKYCEQDMQQGVVSTTFRK